MKKRVVLLGRMPSGRNAVTISESSLKPKVESKVKPKVESKVKPKVEGENLLSYYKDKVVPIVADGVDKNDLPEKVVLYCPDAGARFALTREVYIDFLDFSISQLYKRESPYLKAMGLVAFYNKPPYSKPPAYAYNCGYQNES